MIGFGSAAFGRLVRACRVIGAKTAGLATAMLAGGLIVSAGLAPSAEARLTPGPAAPRLETTSGPVYTNADSISISLNFDMEVRNVDATDFSVIGSTATITGWSVNGAEAYLATISGGDLADLNGKVTIRLQAGQDIESLDGVALTNLETVSEDPVTIDNTAPNCAFATVASAPVEDVFNVTVQCTPQTGFSDYIVAFTESDLVVGNAAVENFSFAGPYAGSFNLRPSSTGTVTVDLPAGSLYDDASNPNPAAPQFSIAADLSPPTVLSIERDDPSDETTNEEKVTIHVRVSAFVVSESHAARSIEVSTGAAWSLVRFSVWSPAKVPLPAWSSATPAAMLIVTSPSASGEMAKENTLPFCVGSAAVALVMVRSEAVKPVTASSNVTVRMKSAPTKSLSTDSCGVGAVLSTTTSASFAPVGTAERSR